MALNPASIPAIVTAQVAAHPSEIALRKKDRGIWKATTWAELGARVSEVSAGLKAMGFRSGHVACIVAETRPEWAYIDLGILGAAGISGGIDPQTEPAQLGEVLREAGCRVLFAENEEQLDKALLVRERCPTLQRIVIIDMKGLREFTDPMCVSLNRFVAADTHAEFATVTSEQPAILLTQEGAQKTLSHGEALELVNHARTSLGLRPGDERLALLPMNEVIERVLGLYLSLSARVVCNFLENPDTAVENLQEVQPTVLATDPRIWQMLHDRVDVAAVGATRLQRMLYRWAVATAARGGATAWLARAVVLHAVKREIGLGRLRVAYSSGASLSSETERWATALGIEIHTIDGKATQGSALGEHRYQPLEQAAYGT